MRYLYDSDRTMERLRQWAGAKNLITTSCFFWSPGSSIQKSQEGLLRSLLYEILLKNLDLIQHTVPWQWRSLELGGRALPLWTNNELFSALTNLVHYAESSTKIIMFIDGLDEFEGSEDIRTETIVLLKRLSKSPAVKVCVSSRPWPVFEDAFQHLPSLLLQDLTYNDIKLYVTSELGENLKFKMLQHQRPHDSSQLIIEIVEKAGGVFLWVHLVVRSLLEGLQNEDDVQDLQRRLRVLPADLDAYFKHMMRGLDEFYLEQANHLFQIALKAPSGKELTLLTYYFVSGKGFDLLPGVEFDRLNGEQIKENCEKMQRRLNSRCKGLLEVHYDTYTSNPFLVPTVDFLHRSVRDFLEFPDTITWIGRFSKYKYDKEIIYTSLCKSAVVQVKVLPLDVSVQESFIKLLLLCFSCALELEAFTGVAQTTILDEFDRAAASLWCSYGRSTSASSSVSSQWVDHVESNVVLYNNSVLSSQPSWNNTFLSLMIMAGMTIYVKAKVKENLRLLAKKDDHS